MKLGADVRKELFSILLLFSGCLMMMLVLYSLEILSEHLKPVALAILVLALISVATAVAAWYVGRRASIRGRAAVVVVGFGTVMVTYAVAYQWLYLRNPRHFVSANQFANVTRQEAFDETLKSLAALSHQLYLLTLLESNPGAVVQANQNRGQWVTVDRTTELYVELLVGPGTGAVAHVVRLRHNGLETQFRTDNPLDPRTIATSRLVDVTTVDEARACVRQLIQLFDRDRLRTAGRIDRLLSDAPLDFVDFLYFSCTTITTVGYGDIVPNSRQARLAVMGEAALGVIYLTFALSVLWRSDRTPPTEKDGPAHPHVNG